MDSIEETSPVGEPGPKKAPGFNRRTTVSRLWKTANLQIEACASRMQATDSTEIEKEARTLATLAKTVRELVEIDRVKSASSATAAESGRADIDLDQFRSELARELDRLRASQSPARLSGDAGPDSARKPALLLADLCS